MAESNAVVVVESRRWVASRARGATLEIGIGGWPSLPFYPADVALTGLDKRAKAVAKATRAVALSGRHASVIEGDAMALAYDNESFDCVVFSFSLCGVPQVHGALVEALRVLRPGGALLMADHIVSTSRPLRVVQRVAEAFTAPIIGEHWVRRPSTQARTLGVEIVETERLGRGAIERLHAVKPR